MLNGVAITLKSNKSTFNQEKLLARKKFSSASNLLEEGKDNVLPQLQAQLNRAFRDKVSF